MAWPRCLFSAATNFFCDFGRTASFIHPRKLGRRRFIPIARLLRPKPCPSLALLLALPPVLRFSPRPVTPVWQAALSRLLALGRVGDGVVVVRLVGPPPARLDGFLRRLSRDETVAAVADEV